MYTVGNRTSADVNVLKRRKEKTPEGQRNTIIRSHVTGPYTGAVHELFLLTVLKTTTVVRKLITFESI